MEESGNPDEITPARVGETLDELCDPGAPVTAAEVAGELDCAEGAARRNLDALAEREALKRKRIDGDAKVWWRPVEARENRTGTTAEAGRREEFQAFVQAVAEYAIFVLDPEGHIETWNEGAERIKGYSSDEIVGEHFSVFYPDEAVEAGVPRKNLEKARENGHFEDEGWRVRENGERFWGNVTITPIRDGDGDLRGFTKVTRDMTERKRREEALRREKERFQRMVEEVRDYAIFMLDPEGFIETWNEGAERIKGYRTEEAVGEHFSMFYPDDEESASPEALLAEAAARGRTADEGWRLRKDGSRFWASVVITALFDDDGELRGFAKITRDLTERKRYEDRLAALDEMGRALLEADTPETACDIVVDAAEADLDLPVATIALYDEESGSLRPQSRTSRAERLRSEVPFLDPASDVPWDAFGGDDPLVVDGLSRQRDRSPTDRSVTGGVVAPVGRHGVFIAGFEDADGPNDEEVDFVKIVAADLEAALNHTERQQLLREREVTLEEQNESLARVNRLNDIIRTIDQTLIGASTREEIERAVCRNLAGAGPYRVAWIGRHDAVAETIEPTVVSGVETGRVEDLAVGGGGPTEEHPASIAARLREPYAIRNIRSDPPFEPWRKEALKRGHRSMISVPIRYESTLYGVLTVQADRPETFTGTEAQVVEELGETIGHAINALESKRALVSDDRVELEFRIRDPEMPLLRLVDHADCSFELDNVLSRADGALSVYFTTHGAKPTEIENFVDQSLVLTSVRLVSEDEGECAFEATVSDESLVATLLDHGAVPRTLTADGGEGRAVVALSARADVREFVETLRTKYRNLELRARRTTERTADTPAEFKAAFEGRITDRQREVLQTAYFSGYFDTPRRSTGEEIGDALGVSQPTVTHHLRACQRELFAMLYDEP